MNKPGLPSGNLVPRPKSHVHIYVTLHAIHIQHVNDGKQTRLHLRVIMPPWLESCFLGVQAGGMNGIELISYLAIDLYTDTAQDSHLPLGEDGPLA